MAGTDNMETMMSISALQPMSQDTISILERAGSRGNSTIRRPVGVKAPESAQESSIQTCHIKGNETQTVEERGAGLTADCWEQLRKKNKSQIKNFASSDLND